MFFHVSHDNDYGNIWSKAIISIENCIKKTNCYTYEDSNVENCVCILIAKLTAGYVLLTVRTEET